MACTTEPACSLKLAVLIDAENAQASKIELLLAEVAKYGTASVKRAYGDWTGRVLQSWKDSLLKHSIQPMQQFAYTTGKNASDSALIIDAMDLLYTNRFGGFCIVSSDSDFTRLASRIRESGLMVIGFGRQMTPTSFVAACDKFVWVESLVSKKPELQDSTYVQEGQTTEDSTTDGNTSDTDGDDDSDTPMSDYSDSDEPTDEDSNDNKPPSAATRTHAVPESVMKIRAALRANRSRRRPWVRLSVVGDYLKQHYPDFHTLYGKLGALVRRPDIRRFIACKTMDSAPWKTHTTHIRER